MVILKAILLEQAWLSGSLTNLSVGCHPAVAPAVVFDAPWYDASIDSPVTTRVEQYSQSSVYRWNTPKSMSGAARFLAKSLPS